MFYKSLILTTTFISVMGLSAYPGMAQSQTQPQRSGALALATYPVGISTTAGQSERPLLTRRVVIAQIQADTSASSLELSSPELGSPPFAVRLQPESPLPSAIPFTTPDQDIYLAPGPVPWGAVGPAYDRGIQAKFRISSD